jgi:formate hydrogenlyase subunit 6/NADH:ubiquinone oxidoreductase subunit I
MNMYMISAKKCSKCKMCIEACPVDAIVERNPAFVIKPEICISCGECMAVCPVQAVKEV